MYVPKTPFVVGYSKIESKSAIMDLEDLPEEQTEEETAEERSIRRTKKCIKEYVLCNPFSIFATFTFAENRYDVDEKKRQISCWLKNQQKRN